MKMTSELEKDRQFVTALGRGLAVLRCFKTGERYLGNQEIAKRTSLPKPTVSRLTYTLTTLGYLNYSKNFGKYYLGASVLSLSASFLSSLDVLQVARTLMQEMADYSHASVSVGGRDHLTMVYIENCSSSDSMVTLRIEVGERIPIETTSMGRAYLSVCPEEERNYLMDQIRIRHKPDEWTKIKAGIEQAFRDYQDKGYCLSLGDWSKDVHGVAVPWVPRDGSNILSFNLAGPAFVLRRNMIEDDLGPRMINLVRNVENARSRT